MALGAGCGPLGGQRAADVERRDRSDHLRHDEERDVDRTNACECIGEGAGDRNRGVSERGRSRKPVCRGNVKANRRWDSVSPHSDGQEDGEHEAERGHPFREPQRRAGANFDRDLEKRLVEHQVRRPHTDPARRRSEQQ
jgi:hypothetical protein